MSSKDPRLDAVLADLLKTLEDEGEIVVCTASPQRIVARIRDTVLDEVPNTGLTAGELAGLRSLAILAVHDRSFFDVEKPTITGFSAEGFLRIVEKLPRP